MADYSGPQGSGPKSKDPMPECTKEYWPGNGGTMADTIESDGAPGDKDGGATSAVTGNTEEGEYNYMGPNSPLHFGPGPHGQPDPDVGGPPLASTDGGPNYTQDQMSPGGGNEGNERKSPGY